MKMMFAAGFRIFVAACRLQMLCSSLACCLYDEVVLDRRLQRPDLYGAVVCDRVVMLVSFRIDVSREGLLAVIGENLEGASVDHDAQLLQIAGQRHVECLADVLVEALVHAGLAYSDDLGCCVIVECDTACAVSLEIHRQGL